MTTYCPKCGADDSQWVTETDTGAIGPHFTPRIADCRGEGKQPVEGASELAETVESA